jgi:hypothetical protein
MVVHFVVDVWRRDSPRFVATDIGQDSKIYPQLNSAGFRDDAFWPLSVFIRSHNVQTLKSDKYLRTGRQGTEQGVRAVVTRAVTTCLWF